MQQTEGNNPFKKLISIGNKRHWKSIMPARDVPIQDVGLNRVFQISQPSSKTSRLAHDSSATSSRHTGSAIDPSILSIINLVYLIPLSMQL